MPPSTPEGTELVRQTAYHFSEVFTDDSDVIQFFTDNLPDFEDEFEDPDDTGEKEHKMSYTDMYKEFEGLMEEKITGVADKMGFDSAVEYFEALQECLGEKEGYAQGELEQKTLDVVIASYDYDKFIEALRHSDRAGRGDGGGGRVRCMIRSIR